MGFPFIRVVTTARLPWRPGENEPTGTKGDFPMRNAAILLTLAALTACEAKTPPTAPTDAAERPEAVAGPELPPVPPLGRIDPAESECRIAKTHNAVPVTVIGPKLTRPRSSDTTRWSVAVAEGDTYDGPDPVLFYPDGDCPEVVEMRIEYALAHGDVPNPAPDDFLLWPSAKADRKWFLTYTPHVEPVAGYDVGLVLRDEGGEALARREVEAYWRLIESHCWLWYDPKFFHALEKELHDSPACEVP